MVKGEARTYTEIHTMPRKASLEAPARRRNLDVSPVGSAEFLEWTYRHHDIKPFDPFASEQDLLVALEMQHLTKASAMLADRGFLINEMPLGYCAENWIFLAKHLGLDPSIAT